MAPFRRAVRHRPAAQQQQRVGARAPPSSSAVRPSSSTWRTFATSGDPDGSPPASPSTRPG